MYTTVFKLIRASNVFKLIRAIQLAKKACQSTWTPSQSMLLTEGSRLCLVLGGICVRIDVVFFAWNSPPKKAVYNEKAVSPSQSSPTPLVLPAFVLFSLEALCKARHFVASSNCAVLWCGPLRVVLLSWAVFQGIRKPFSIPGASLKVRKFCGLVWISLIPIENLVCQSLHTCQHK